MDFLTPTSRFKHPPPIYYIIKTFSGVYSLQSNLTKLKGSDRQCMAVKLRLQYY